MEAEVVEVQRGPQEEQAVAGRRGGSATGVATGQWSDAPGPVLGASGGSRVELQTATIDVDPTAPPSHLGEPGGVHGSSDGAAPVVSGLLDVSRPALECEVAGEPGLVGLQHHLAGLHGFQHLKPERPHLLVGRVPFGPTRGVEGVLYAVDDHAQAAVSDSEVRVVGGSDPEEPVGVGRVAVKPIALVYVLVAGRRGGDGVRGLVDGVVVEPREHGGGPVPGASARRPTGGHPARRASASHRSCRRTARKRQGPVVRHW